MDEGGFDLDSRQLGRLPKKTVVNVQCSSHMHEYAPFVHMGQVQPPRFTGGESDHLAPASRGCILYPGLLRGSCRDVTEVEAFCYPSAVG